MDKVDALFDFDRAALAQWFERAGEPAYRATQVTQWVHQRGVLAFDAMTNLGKALRARLAASFTVSLPAVQVRQESADGTRKWLLALTGGGAIEMVYIPEDDRGTLCISSQVGCALDCRFCSTALQGFNRNLTTGEILSQLWIARHGTDLPGSGITNVVFMGMGEPLLNFRHVVRAARVMLDDFGYGLSRRRVTVSTAGVVPMVDRLREECDVSLAVSLHAPDNALRDELVPVNRRYPIDELLAACRRYARLGSRRHVTFEYVLLAGVNDRPEHARALAGLLHDLPAKINLIPFNPFPGAPYRRPDTAAIDRFRDILWNAGLITITRKTRGDDIDAACGQLVGRVENRARHRLRDVQVKGRMQA